MRLLPFDVTDFAELRRGGYLYADKTRPLYDPVTRGAQVFLMEKAPGEGLSFVVLEESNGLLVVELEYRETQGALEVAMAEAMALVERTGYDLRVERWYETIHKATLVVSGRAAAGHHLDRPLLAAGGE